MLPNIKNNHRKPFEQICCEKKIKSSADIFIETKNRPNTEYDLEMVTENGIQVNYFDIFAFVFLGIRLSHKFV